MLGKRAPGPRKPSELLHCEDKDNLFLSKVYAPVDEETTRACEVVG
ncbi:unnamed protein product, partial [Ectocarpus sp. 12 AP-2014]